MRNAFKPGDFFSERQFLVLDVLIPNNNDSAEKDKDKDKSGSNSNSSSASSSPDKRVPSGSDDETLKHGGKNRKRTLTNMADKL